MILDKKQIWAIFLFKFKMCHKAAKTTCNINNAFGPGISSEHTVQWWFKKFCKGDKSLEDEEHSGQSSEVDNGQLRAIMEADPLASTQEVAEEPNIDYSAIIQHLKQTGKVKKLDKWVPHDLRANQKDCHFEVLSSHNLHSNNEPFLDWMCRVTKSEFYTTTDKNQLSSWTLKKLQSTSQSQTCTTKKKKKGHGHCLVVCCWSDPLQLSESWQNHYIWEIHSANQWDALKAATPGARLVNRKGPILLEDNTQWHGAQPALKNWTNWATKFCLICHIPWPLANWLPFLQASQQLFVRKMFPQSAGGRKCFPRVCWILKHGFLCYRNKQTYFSLARTYWL